MEIKDIAGLSQPLTKLIGVVSGAIGTLYKPKAIRSEADAEAYKIEALAKAEAKKTLIEGDAKIELLARAKERLVFQELKRQANVEEIADKSISYLEDVVSEEPLDEDWKTRFFNKAQDVSNEEMQEVWAKILASEVSKPGTIGYRTLDIISNLSRKEAEIFQFACTFVTANKFIWKMGYYFDLHQFGLTYEMLMVLKESSLIHESDILHLSLKMKKVGNNPSATTIEVGNDIYILTNEKDPEIEKAIFNQIALTIAGKELSKIITVEKNTEYFNAFFEAKKSQGYKFQKLEIEK